MSPETAELEVTRLTVHPELEAAEALRWLAPVDSRERYLRAMSSHHPGTSKWFIDGPFSKLLGSPAGQSCMLWLKGKCKLCLPSSPCHRRLATV